MKSKFFFIILLFFFNALYAEDFNISAKNIKIDKDKQTTVFESDVFIEDDKKNVTRFLIMGKNAKHPEFKKDKYITSCIFKVKDKPAALYKCLGGFATNNISLSKLESFSEHSSFEQYLFLCDIVGHIEDPKVQKSLEELGFHTVSLDILGVYKASHFRDI